MLDYSMGSVARMVSGRNQAKIGRNQLFELLRAEGVLTATNKPHSQYSGKGFFVRRIVPLKRGRKVMQTRVTQQGVRLILDVLADKNCIWRVG